MWLPALRRGLASPSSSGASSRDAFCTGAGASALRFLSPCAPSAEAPAALRTRSFLPANTSVTFVCLRGRPLPALASRPAVSHALSSSYSSIAPAARAGARTRTAAGSRGRAAPRLHGSDAHRRGALSRCPRRGPARNPPPAILGRKKGGRKSQAHAARRPCGAPRATPAPAAQITDRDARSRPSPPRARRARLRLSSSLPGLDALERTPLATRGFGNAYWLWVQSTGLNPLVTSQWPCPLLSHSPTQLLPLRAQVHGYSSCARRG